MNNNRPSEIYEQFLGLAARLHRMATVDEMTGLSNGRAFEEDLRSCIREAAESGAPFAIALGDIDDFKHRCNEFRGRLDYCAGDAAMRQVADVLKHNISARRGDTCYPYRPHGRGDEFALILRMPPGVALPRVQQVARRIRRARITHESERMLVSVSFGVAEFPAHGASAEALIAAATAALDRAKVSRAGAVVLASKL